MFNVPAAIWKNQMPIRAPLSNHVVLPQRPPVKEFHSVNKMPEYSPEYRPEAAVLPPTHRGGVDDDKGPIHTIPAPNLSPMDKPFNGDVNGVEAHQRQPSTDASFKHNPHGSLLILNDCSDLASSVLERAMVVLFLRRFSVGTELRYRDDQHKPGPAVDRDKSHANATPVRSNRNQ